MKQIRILVADDHTLVREGLKQILAASPDMVVGGEAGDGFETLAQVRAGAFTLAQDEASCVVYGMPREAVKHGGVDRTLPLSSLAGAIMRGPARV